MRSTVHGQPADFRGVGSALRSPDSPTSTGSTRLHTPRLASVGPVDIVANAGGVSKTQTIIVQTTRQISRLRRAILSASVSANPSVVPTNTVGSTEQSHRNPRAVRRRANNARFQNVRVKFDLNGDRTSIGGTFSTGNAILYSRRQRHRHDRVHPSRPCQSDKRRDDPSVLFDTATSCLRRFRPRPLRPRRLRPMPNQTLATITVVADPLSVTIGSNEFVYTGADDLTYIRKFVILVVDAAGRAKGNVDVVPSIDLPHFYKGQYVTGSGWIPGIIDNTGNPSPRDPVQCNNEDLNRNGVLETGDDTNQNGTLEPRKSDAVVSFISWLEDEGRWYGSRPDRVPQECRHLGSRPSCWFRQPESAAPKVDATWTEILPAPADAFSSTGAPAFVFQPVWSGYHA